MEPPTAFTPKTAKSTLAVAVCPAASLTVYVNSACQPPACTPPIACRFASGAVKRSERMNSAELKIEILPAVTFCENCEKTYETVKYGRTCPHCGSDKT